MGKITELQYGQCLYCGQMVQIVPGTDESILEIEKMPQIEKDRRATEDCTCMDAKIARRRKEALIKCKSVINDMFQEDENGTHDLLILAAAFIQRGTIQKVTIKDQDDVMISIADKGDKGIEVSRQVKRKEARLL